MKSSYADLARLVRDEPLPCALVDLDAVHANVDALARAAGAHKKIRVATKSIRCPDLVRVIQKNLGARSHGLMTYTARETEFWANEGERDLLLAYPTMARDDARRIAEINARDGFAAAIVVDCADHLVPLSEAANAVKTSVPCVIELDLAYRPFGNVVHLGVRRSPLREAKDVVALAEKITETDGLTFHGVMAYEAQIAGVSDSDLATRAMKAASRADVANVRAEISRALARANLKPTLFNGGGSGSLDSSSKEECLTELTAGSGFLDSHLFDHYEGLTLSPAIFFALQVVRRATDDIFVCHGGGYIASGKAGPDRSPIPWLPEGLALVTLEGAGEVQTPIAFKNRQMARAIDLGAPIFFRHAKAGELAAHFNEYLFVRGDRIESRARTYRGLGHSFLG